jgi:hypothetical protein
MVMFAKCVSFVKAAGSLAGACIDPSEGRLNSFPWPAGQGLLLHF